LYFTSLFFFFNPPPPSVFYTLSLHDALPICIVHWSARKTGPHAHAGPSCSPLESVSGGAQGRCLQFPDCKSLRGAARNHRTSPTDRKSTRLNSSHRTISYAVFCLKKKKKKS